MAASSSQPAVTHGLQLHTSAAYIVAFVQRTGLGATLRSKAGSVGFVLFALRPRVFGRRAVASAEGGPQAGDGSKSSAFPAANREKLKHGEKQLSFWRNRALP
jgi:hypothetical protein